MPAMDSDQNQQNVQGSTDQNAEPDLEMIRQQMHRILASPGFCESSQLCNFLRFIVEETLAGCEDGIKQYTIAVKALGRKSSFNPQTDPIVRIEARRLRRKLEQYYREHGAEDIPRIEVPVGRYVPAFRFEKVESDRDRQEVPRKDRARGPSPVSLPGGPSIVILPFGTLTDDPEQLYYADGLAQALVVELTRFPDFLIIGPLSRQKLKGQTLGPRALGRQYGAHFVLDGHLRKQANSVRLSVKLVDVVTGGTLWADTYDHRASAADLFEFEDTVINQVASILADNYGVIPRRLIPQAVEKRTDRIEAYDAVLRFYHYVTVYTAEAWRAAFEALERAVQLDPGYALALAMLADMHVLGYQFLGLDATALEQSQDLVRRAIILDPQCQHARFVRATISLLRQQTELFLEETELAIPLNPNNAHLIASCGSNLALSGEWARGMALVERALHLNPHIPAEYHIVPFMDYYLRGLYREALREALRFNTPGLFWDPLIRAATLGQLGHKNQATTVLKELLEMRPQFAAHGRDWMRRTVFSDASVEALVEGLHRAGLQVGG